ncbi:hypothetical protein ACH5RR_020978 [Cinchona calisaya]|uniref:Sialate O-acetylesterase domain-containing protein n=1 Tax=Cinchona calisaya TaxID=153742 RepID=A0ABD2ZGZ9_9GENT
MLVFLWLMLLAYAEFVSTADLNSNVYSSPPSQVRSIFLLAGQSNMSGRGGVINSTWDGIVPIQSQPKPSKILRLSAGLQWVEANEPLHRDIDVNATCGVGPGMVFANTLLNINPRIGVIGLVPCAVGSRMGTKISQWGRGTYLYNQLLRRAKAAAALQVGGRFRIRALLWYQGESDTTNPQDASLYKMRLERFFTNLRVDLKLPALPIIQVALASGQGPFVDTVRQAQFGIHLRNVKTIDARGLPMQPDNLHLSTPAQVQLGEKFAKAFAATG